MRNRRRSLILSALALGIIFTTSSCHRGSGCPGEYSIGDIATTVFKAVISIF